MQEFVTYLTFDGDCRAAMTFYADVLAGQLHLTTVGEHSPESPDAQRILHARLDFPGGILMASDTMSANVTPFVPGTNFALSIATETSEEQAVFFALLGDGGTVTMPLQDTFWGARFGMLKDKFGITWMFNHDK